MIQTTSPLFKEIMTDVLFQLVNIDFRGGSAYVRTPMMYPSGSTVVVRHTSFPTWDWATTRRN
jgi:hypothetical protein